MHALEQLNLSKKFFHDKSNIIFDVTPTWCQNLSTQGKLNRKKAYRDKSLTINISGTEHEFVIQTVMEICS